MAVWRRFACITSVVLAVGAADAAAQPDEALRLRAGVLRDWPPYYEKIAKVGM